MAFEWWKNAVIYQIYPRSFKDSDGDGIGDLNGILDKMPYIASLGVDCLWLCPFFQSPQRDFGYDVADYRRIDPRYGDDGTFDRLIQLAHRHQLRVLVDLPFNHTSNEHPWFQQSRLGRDNPKADWYIWADGKGDGSPPNNWLSLFGGSAWTFDEVRQQYYCHNFLESQPDLNFHHPEVRQAVLDIVRYWMDRGADGCRLDVCNFYFHDQQLRDNPPNHDPSTRRLHIPDHYNQQRHIYSKTRPENIAFIKRIRAVLDEYPDSFAIAEIDDQNSLQVMADYTADRERLHSAYTFAQTNGRGLPDAAFFRDIIERQADCPGDSFPGWMFSNHDIIRAPSRWAEQEFSCDADLSKLLVRLLCTLRGVLLLYQGDELGLPEAEVPYACLKDPWGLYLYPKWQGRDGSRVPMPWDADARHLGFGDGVEPWLPLPESYRELAVSRQQNDPDSTLAVTRAFLAWRKQHPAIMSGDIGFLDELPSRVLGIRRHCPGEELFGLFNLSHRVQRFTHACGNWRRLSIDGISEHVTVHQEQLEMAPYAVAFFAVLQN